MKKIFFTLAVVFAMITVAKADSYLYWMMDDASFEKYDGKYNSVKIMYDATGSSAWEALTLYTYGDSGMTSLGESVAADALEAQYNAGGGYYIKLAADITGNSSFIIELFNDQIGVIGQTAELAYSSRTAGSIAEMTAAGIFTPATTPWAMGPVGAPEPTSGLLMLLGMAALGLKRRKMTNA